MKKIILFVIGFSLAVSCTIFAARTDPSSFDQDGTAVYLGEDASTLSIGTSTATTIFTVVGTSTFDAIVPRTDSTYTFGTNALRWKTAYIDALHSETIAIDGTSAGNMDMANNLILNIGATGTDFTSGGGLTLAGTLIINATTTQTGNFTTSGIMGVGTTTPSGGFNLWASATTTMYIGDATHSGCIVMGDSDLGGLSYITILDGTVAATTTKPAICQ